MWKYCIGQIFAGYIDLEDPLKLVLTNCKCLKSVSVGKRVINTSQKRKSPIISNYI